MNPILPDKYFIPDVEARVMPDGRLYLYGSWGDWATQIVETHELHCLSTDDLVHWEDHGLIYRNDETWAGLPWDPTSYLWAPDAVHKDGKYYLYVCGSNGKEGVAVSDSPIGPFPVAEPISIADGDGIDPAIFVDDDGKAYYYWGQFHLRGGQLADDMKTLIPETVNENIITEWEHGFHEGASVRKRNGKYYLVYTDISRGRATCMSYAIADHPLGPYRKCGVIVDNVYCDPQTWNDHGSIEEFNGQWYVFYHKASQNSFTWRRVSMEPIEFDENGLIKEVEMTSQGAFGPLDAFSTIPARTACRIMGTSYIGFTEEREVLTSVAGKHWKVNDWAEYKYINFGTDTPRNFRVNVHGKGTLTLKVDGNEAICTAEFDNATFSDVTVPVTAEVTGVHKLWLFMDGDFEVMEFVFEK